MRFCKASVYAHYHRGKVVTEFFRNNLFSFLVILFVNIMGCQKKIETLYSCASVKNDILVVCIFFVNCNGC